MQSRQLVACLARVTSTSFVVVVLSVRVCVCALASCAAAGGRTSRARRGWGGGQDESSSIVAYSLPSAVDADGNEVVFNDAVTLTFAKSATSLEYDLSYVKDFYNSVTEVITTTDTSGETLTTLFNDCDPNRICSGARVRESSCGWDCLD